MRFLKDPVDAGRVGSGAMRISSQGMPVADVRAPASALAPADSVPEPQPQATSDDAALLANEARLATALWGAGMGLWETDLHSGTTRWFSDWCERLDLDPCVGENHAARWNAYVHSDDVATATQRLNDHIAGKLDAYAAEYRIRDKNGRWRWLFERARVVEWSADGTARRIVGVCMDIGARKEAEEALRTSEFRYRSVASMAPGYIFEYRFLPDGGLENMWVSDGVNAVFGATHEEIERRGGRHTLFDPEWQAIIDDRRRGLARGEPQSGEIRAHTVDGQLKWLYGSAVPVRDPRNGTVIGAIGSVYDITERKLAEIALSESRTTLQTVAASSADWLALFDRQRKCVFLNRPIRGLTPDPWLGASVEDFAPPEDRARVHQIFEHVINTGEPRDFDQVFSDPNQGLRYLELRVRAVQSDDRVLGAVVNITEVTERHAQRDALRTQARILETMREGVALVDAQNFIIRLTNATLDRMFGWRAGELLGQSIEPLLMLSAAQRKRVERSLLQHAGAPGAQPVELECARRDGSRFVASCVITPLGMGGTDHWLAVLNDVTERKRLEREIIEIANREQQRIGGDLHDGLGQDLTGIALLLRGVVAQLRKERSNARLDVEDVIGLVNTAIESTRTLARGLSPVSTGRGGLTAALQTLATRATERYGVRVEFKDGVEEPLRFNETAATHLYRIAQEALTNVVRHSSATEVMIGLETVGEELQLRIDDNGHGFTHQPLDDATGLGLKIMRYRAQMLGGDLFIESSANGGASVRCSCPLTP
jgi:two-component system sensor kinase FixL